jgi:hypothetical protein
MAYKRAFINKLSEICMNIDTILMYLIEYLCSIFVRLHQAIDKKVVQI